METTYIISFGDSVKYRLSLPQACAEDSACGCLDTLKNNIREYLEEKFPQIRGLKFYDKMTVVPVDAENSAEYAGYPEFTPESVPAIKRVLSTEVEDAESLELLNSNAAFGAGADPDATGLK